MSSSLFLDNKKAFDITSQGTSGSVELQYTNMAIILTLWLNIIASYYDCMTLLDKRNTIRRASFLNKSPDGDSKSKIL